MAFYTGSANSFGDLQSALFSACAANGYSNNGVLLTKGSLALSCTVSSTESDTLGKGLILQGGTGASGGALVNPSPITPRLGTPHRLVEPIAWPVEYDIHVHDEPDECYLVIRFNVDVFLFLAFGLSKVPGLPGTGLWLSASCRAGMGSSAGAGGIYISPVAGGTPWGSATMESGSSGALFWDTQPTSLGAYNQDTIQSGFDGQLWAGIPTASENQTFNAVRYAAPHIERSPSAWNSEGILLPIQGYVRRSPQKVSLAADLEHARYIRVDNYNPGDLITLGGDRWKVYPFYRKNSAVRDGGSFNMNHTGTMGWAVRYDGP